MMEWALELVLSVLLAATLFHALRLERALGVLKRDRVALEALVETFNTSTRLAEQGIDRLRCSAEGAGRQLSHQIEVAGGLKNDLLLLSDRGENLADRMEQLVRSARTVEPTPSFEPRHLVRVGEHEAAGGLRPRESGVSLRAEEVEREEPQLRLRSQAERDLLKALKMVR